MHKSDGAFSLNHKWATIRRTIHLAILIVIAAGSLMATQNRPKLSGRWELDPARSVLRPTKWNNLAIVIDHQEPRLNINMILKYAQGPDYTYNIPLNTSSHPVSVTMAKTSRSYRANWVGTKLVVKWNEEGARTETWSLSPDGTTLTIVGSARLSNGGSENWKYVMVKR